MLILSKFRKKWETLFLKQCRDFISLSYFERLFLSLAAATLSNTASTVSSVTYIALEQVLKSFSRHKIYRQFE